LIGQINPPSSKGHKFVLLATDYFSKWVEAIPLKKVTLENMVDLSKNTSSTDLGFLKQLRLIKELNLCL
jgi:hypothetical protein